MSHESYSTFGFGIGFEFLDGHFFRDKRPKQAEDDVIGAGLSNLLLES